MRIYIQELNMKQTFIFGLVICRKMAEAFRENAVIQYVSYRNLSIQIPCKHLLSYKKGCDNDISEIITLLIAEITYHSKFVLIIDIV